MIDSDRSRFAAILNAVMVEVYQREPISPIGMQIWCNALQAYSLAEVSRALSAHTTNADTGQFPPKPADIVRHLTGTGDARAFAAWSMVLAGIQSVGTYRSVVFDDPLIHAAITDMGGWVSLGQTKVDEMPFRAAEFARRYRAYLIAKPSHYPRSLTGILEQGNVSTGHPVDPPVLIGNPESARQVYLGGGTVPVITEARSLADVLKLLPARQVA